MPDLWWFVTSFITVIAWLVFGGVSVLCVWSSWLLVVKGGHWLYEKLEEECSDCRRKREKEMGRIDHVITVHDAVEILEQAPHSERQRAIQRISRGNQWN